MPAQLWSTTLDPSSRTLRKLTLDDAADASHMFALLMGDKVGAWGLGFRVWGAGGGRGGCRERTRCSGEHVGAHGEGSVGCRAG